MMVLEKTKEDFSIWSKINDLPSTQNTKGVMISFSKYLGFLSFRIKFKIKRIEK